jgi:hypothetical protein
MNMSRRFGRIARSLFSDRGAKPATPRVGRAARLAACAGAAAGEHGLEQLENRQLLFTIAIGPSSVDPLTGVGTRTVDFEYFAPYLLHTTAITPMPDTNFAENFDDEMAPWTTGNPPVPNNGTFFDMSRIQLSYQSASTTPARLIRRGTTDNALRVDLAGTDTMTFTIYDPQAQAGSAGDVPHLATSARFALSRNSAPSDGGDINTDPNTGTRIELINNGVVVKTYKGAEIDAIRAGVFIGPSFLLNTFQYTLDFAPGFDAVRFSSAADAPNNATYSDNFVIEQIAVTLPGNTYAMSVDGQIRGVRLSFSGPAGATVQLLDLYGRDMQQRDNLRIPTGGDTSPIDRNKDGMPDFNDGIGRVIINGTNAASSITMIGYAPDNMGAKVFPDGPAGFNAIMGGTDFGFQAIGNPPVVLGLPPVGISLLIGAPFVRDNSTAPIYRSNLTGALDFIRADQGVFVNGGSIGSVLIAGAMFGSSRIDGAVGRWSVGYQAGSLRVDGDVGSFVSQSECGGWFRQDGGGGGAFTPTGSRLTFGRTVREIDIAARNLATVSVLADVNNPNRARLVQRDFFTRESIYGFTQQTNGGVATVIRTIAAGPDWAGNLGGSGQAIPFGASYYRNDSILSAEFVGYNGTSVRIFGSANGVDPVNTAFDSTDVYAFPADSSREVVIAAPLAILEYVRVVDRDGRVVAALDAGGRGRGPDGTNIFGSVFRFLPDHSDVYYLVVNSDVAQTTPTTGQYQITLSGMAPVTLGAFRTGSGAVPSADPYVFTLAAGDMGSVRLGTGYSTSGGGESDTSDIAIGLVGSAGIADLPHRRYLGWGPSTVSVPGNLYNMTIGGSVSGTIVNPAQLLVRGNLGTFVTGTFARSIFNGDLYNANIRVGGSISLMDIKGGMAIEQHPDPARDDRNGLVNIQTGTVPGLRGDIGRILIGAYMHGGSTNNDGTGVTIRTSPGSQFDQLIVGSNNDGAGSEHPGEIIDGVPNISVGDGSDVRFVTFTRLLIANIDTAVRIPYGGSYQVVDDAGATVTIGVGGGSDPLDPTMDPRPGSFADVRLLRINGSRGYAIARIDTTLLGGASLTLSGNTAGIVTVGRIVVANADSGGGGGPGPATPAPNPTVDISGTTQIDVGRIDQQLGALDAITNTTPNGDIVAIDALRLRSLTVNGHLGRTQLSAASQALLGPYLGITAQNSVVGGPILLNPNSINVANGGDTRNWATEAVIFTPITNPGYASPNYPMVDYLEDIGSPVDPYLDGVIVRTGDLENVTVNGTVGDVIVQTGHLLNLVANADGLTPQGGFQGIEGNVYAVAIGSVDAGDGLRGTGPSPFAQASIVADRAIVQVIFGGGRIQNSVDQGVIMAANVGGPLAQLGTSVQTPTTIDPPLNGIGIVRGTNARFDTALFYGGALDDFWHSQRVLDGGILTADIGTITGTNTDLFRCDVSALNVAAITLSGGGAYDATTTLATYSIGSIIADEFRNSTRLGVPAEAYPNRITAGHDMTSLTTNGLAGDISDLAVDLGGSLLVQASARNIQRTDFSIVNITASIHAVYDVRSVSVQSGRLVNMDAGASIRSTSVLIAGPIQSVTAGDEITQTLLNSSGPDGRIDLVRAQHLLDADITSSGNIGSISSTTGDVQGSITTRNDDVRANNGGLASLTAGNDLLVELSILGDTGTILAARNIGAFGALNPDLDLRGNLGNITSTAGQIYSDLLVGQSITGAITTGRVNMKPGFDRVASSDILVFGRINALVLNSDFDGNITSRSGGIGSITFNRGSFRPGHAITVNNGNLDQLTFNGGDLLGNVFVDGNIGAVDMLVDAFGFKSQIGIASWRRNFKPANGDTLRNELPPGVIRTPGIDGVTIKAGGSIGRVFVERGSMTESQIIAGTTIGTVHVVLQTRNDALNVGLNNAIVAGDRIDMVQLDGFTGAVAILAGVIDLGADGRVGGIGADADTVKSGSIGSVLFNGRKVVNSVVGAGIAPDSAGHYNTSNAFSAVGRSAIDNVTALGTVVGVSAYSAGTLGSTSGGIVRGGTLAPAEANTLALDATGTEVELANGISFLFQLPSGERGRATLTGPGRAFYDPAQGRLRLSNTTTTSTLTIVPNGLYLTDLSVLGNANCAMGSLNVSGTLRGASTVFLNGDITSVSFGNIDSLGGLFGSGGNVSSITTGNFLAGVLRARTVGAFTVNGDFGRSAVASDAFADFLNVTTVNVTGAVSGAISSDRGLPTLAAGSVNNGGIRSGLSIGSVTVGSMLGGRISARTSIGSVVVNGDATESQILGGADLGHDADFGGSGRNADVLGSGSVNSVQINGNFRKSDIGAGVLRGPSGYLGNADAIAAAGRSSIGAVAITGNLVGSNLNSEQYRILSTGTIGAVTVGGNPFTGSSNFKVERIAAVAVPVRVLDLFVTENSRIYTASIVFNQNIDISTLSAALSVVELRNSGAITIGLAEGTDYTFQYDKARNTVKVIFSRTVTERGLPQSPGLPGPGVYQFILNAQILRGSTQDSLLDGNGDGIPGDDYAGNVVVGDAGDKITSGRPAGDPSISFYPPTDLDLVLRHNANIGTLPDTNTFFTVRGSIGDHPNSDPDTFALGGDVDVYRITLRAGQILRMGEFTGTALGAVRALFDSSGNEIGENSNTGPTGGAPGSAAVRLPNNFTTELDVTSEDQYLITQTDTYYIVVAGTLTGVDIADTNAIANNDPVAGAFGLYAFSIEVFDDGNTGFVGDTRSGTAAPLVTPPTPIVFAGFDGIFGNGDDLSTFTQGDWVFRLTPGTSSPGGADAVVTGVNSQGWTVTRTAAPNGTFGSANDRIFTSAKTSIGLPGSSGVPDEISPDVDIFSLNNGLPIAAGTKIRATLRLTKTGANIGLSPEITTNPTTRLVGDAAGQDLLGQAQFAIFETPAGTGFNNARLVSATSGFLPIGGQPAQTITDNRNSYGYDANGDFFMEFIVPGAQGVPSLVPAAYALYVQGAIRSDYTLEIVQQGTGSTTTLPQNVLLETNGGLIDWLEAGDKLTTRLSAFTTSVLGFTGQLNGQDIDTYVLTNLIANLNAIFTAANVNIAISTNPNDFAHQDFSTVVLAGNIEPNAFFGNGSYGASQNVDFFNVNKNDQAVVFVSSLADLGFEPSSTGIDRFVTALTGAVARRIGELVGVRMETALNTGASPIPVMASDSVTQGTSGGYAFADTVRNLAGLTDNATDTIFYLGTQNASSLIQRVILRNA